MRTKLRSKFTLLFLTLAVLIAVPAIAYAADQIVADGDTITAGDQSSRNLGTVAPGATVTPNANVDFYLDCAGSQHFNSGELATISFDSAGSSIKDAANNTPSTGSVSATNLTSISGPTNWPADGDNACPTANALLGSSATTIVAPKKPGTYTYTVNYTVTRGTGTANNELTTNIQNAPVKFTLTVNNVAPVINSFNGDTTATEGNTKPYSIL